MCGDSLQRRLVMELKDLDSLLPEIPMSPKEIVNYFVDNCSDNTFAEAEKVLPQNGRQLWYKFLFDTRKVLNPISPAVYYGVATFNIKKHE